MIGISDLTSVASGVLSGGSLSGMAVFHNTVQILIGESAQSMVDVTAMMPPMALITIHFEDPISFQADTLELTFADIGDQIIKSARMKKGLWVKVKINQFNRDYPGSHVQKDLGSFQIDQIKTRWPPTQVTLMASSVPIGSQVKLTLQNKTRLATTLPNLAETVAKENGWKFLWDAPTDTHAYTAQLSQAQQWNESDLSMLSRMLRSNGLAMKIKEINGFQTLVVFDEQDLEKKPPVYTIDFAQPGAGICLEHGELTTQSQDIYSGSTFAWFDSNSNTFYVADANAPPETATGSKEWLKTWTTNNTGLGKDSQATSDD